MDFSLGLSKLHEHPLPDEDALLEYCTKRGLGTPRKYSDKKMANFCSNGLFREFEFTKRQFCKGRRP